MADNSKYKEQVSMEAIIPVPAGSCFGTDVWTYQVGSINLIMILRLNCAEDVLKIVLAAAVIFVIVFFFWSKQICYKN